MHAIVHLVGGQQPAQFRDECRLIESWIQANLLETPIQAVHVLRQKEQRAFVQTKPLPDPVANDEASIEDGHHRLVASDMATVEADQRLKIARIGGKILTAGHPGILPSM